MMFSCVLGDSQPPGGVDQTDSSSVGSNGSSSMNTSTQSSVLHTKCLRLGKLLEETEQQRLKDGREYERQLAFFRQSREADISEKLGETHRAQRALQQQLVIAESEVVYWRSKCERQERQEQSPSFQPSFSPSRSARPLRQHLNIGGVDINTLSSLSPATPREYEHNIQHDPKQHTGVSSWSPRPYIFEPRNSCTKTDLENADGDESASGLFNTVRGGGEAYAAYARRVTDAAQRKEEQTARLHKEAIELLRFQHAKQCDVLQDKLDCANAEIGALQRKVENMKDLSRAFEHSSLRITAENDELHQRIKDLTDTREAVETQVRCVMTENRRLIDRMTIAKTQNNGQLGAGGVYTATPTVAAPSNKFPSPSQFFQSQQRASEDGNDNRQSNVCSRRNERSFSSTSLRPLSISTACSPAPTDMDLSPTSPFCLPAKSLKSPRVQTLRKIKKYHSEEMF